MARLALVVDDSMLIRHTVCRFLEERGFSVEVANDGMEALEILARVRPRLIITDLSMPRMTGSELITTLKNVPETAAIPIIILATRRTAEPYATDSRVQFVIYKDIDLQQQLENAVTTLCGEA